MDDEKLKFDVNMDWAFAFAKGLGNPPKLPDELTRIESKANFLNEIDGSFFVSIIDESGVFLIHFAQRLVEVATISAKWMPGISEEISRINISLRLWSGCMAAAKTIALETRSGQNTPELRSQIFLKIDQIANNNPIYLAGVEAAPVFKRQRQQEYSFEGVPENSPVRRYPA